MNKKSNEITKMNLLELEDPRRRLPDFTPNITNIPRNEKVTLPAGCHKGISIDAARMLRDTCLEIIKEKLMWKRHTLWMDSSWLRKPPHSSKDDKVASQKKTERWGFKIEMESGDELEDLERQCLRSRIFYTINKGKLAESIGGVYERMVGVVKGSLKAIGKKLLKISFRAELEKGLLQKWCDIRIKNLKTRVDTLMYDYMKSLMQNMARIRRRARIMSLAQKPRASQPNSTRTRN
ncbi:hypothetical protein DINM_006993 [Dirofilaria immitis]|nr:hypothetical protein [Dirofilaria immitis]